MNEPVLIDTGPLVASINRRDRFHDWAREWLNKLEPPLLTCEAVLAESCFILRSCPGGGKAVMELVIRGVVTPTLRINEQISAIAKLMEKYRNTPMSFADACLVRMSELEPEARVMTLDSDFRIYRKHGRQVIPLITPEQW